MAIVKSIKITRYPLQQNPTVFDLSVEEFDFKKNTKYNEVNCLLSKVPTKVKGSAEPSGSLGVNLTRQSMPLIVELALGSPDTTANTTSDTWQSDTVMQVGDTVNHSDNKHSLVVKRIKGDGKTGATEPTITVNGNNTEIIEDNNVVWEATPLSKKATYTFKDTAPLFIVEYAIDDKTGGNLFYKQFLGCEINNLPLKVELDDNIPKWSLDIKAMDVVDSTETGWQSDLASVSGVKIVNLANDYYSADDKSKYALLNGNAKCIDSIDITLDKGIEIKKCANGTGQGISKRNPKAEGSISLDFTTEEYQTYQNEEAFKVEMFFKALGSYAKFTFAETKAEETDPSFKSREEVMLEPKIWAEGDVVAAEVVYPAFIDNNGDIVEF